MTPGSVDRFSDALYTSTEAARYLDVPESTVRRWIHSTPPAEHGVSGVRPHSVITALVRGRGHAAIPFVGLAEAYSLRALREAGVPLQRIRPALEVLGQELGLEHALASQRLYTDGAEILHDFATSVDSDAAAAAMQLVVVRHGQRVFADVVAGLLTQVTYVAGYAQSLPLPGYTQAEVVVDAGRGFGQPIFKHGGARLEDALELFGSGEPLEVVAEEFGVSEVEIEDALRVALRRAA